MCLRVISGNAFALCVNQSQVKHYEISCPQELTTNPAEEDPNRLSPAWAWIHIKQQMLQEGATGLEGIAAAGDLERKVLEFLDKNL